MLPANDSNLNILNSDITAELKTSFLNYSMSVIVARALPDLCDGLKPVHRRIIYAMYKLGLFHNKPYKKSARIVGEVIGKYHPHGDSSVYGALVRLSQDFNYLHPLIQGHGNFGSIDGDAPAAMRYTEIRLAEIANELVLDIEKNTVPFVSNYDSSEIEPLILPSYFPNILVNGSSGIAVGMATQIPPHNLNEIIDVCIYLLNNPLAAIEEIMNCIKGPDFPTGGLIYTNKNLNELYATGSGSFTLRGSYHIENENKIIITEVPYQTNKVALLTKINEALTEGKIKGIQKIKDESNYRGIRIVIFLKTDSYPQIVINQLLKYTQLQINYHVNLLALDNGIPKTLSLPAMLNLYLQHCETVLVKKTTYELEILKKRSFIINALVKALNQLDATIELIKNSPSPTDANNKLQTFLQISKDQAQAILDLRLQRLTALEQNKLKSELEEITTEIIRLEAILGDKNLIKKEIQQNLERIKDKYGVTRKTKILDEVCSLELEHLIPEQDVVITCSQKMYIKQTPLTDYRLQHRGGLGIVAAKREDGDEIAQLRIFSSHDELTFFTNLGRTYRCHIYDLPQQSRYSRGTPIQSVIKTMQKNEKIVTMESLKTENNTSEAILFITKHGLIKKTAANDFSRINVNGKIAIKLHDDDQIIAVLSTDKTKYILIGNYNGYVVKFDHQMLRITGRVGIGNIAMRSRGIKKLKLLSATVCNEADAIFLLSSKGYGKVCNTTNFRLTKRGAKGVKTFRSTNEGELIYLTKINEQSNIMAVTNTGRSILCSSNDVRELKSRIAKGVRVIKLKENETIVSAFLNQEPTPILNNLTTTPNEVHFSENQPVN